MIVLGIYFITVGTITLVVTGITWATQRWAKTLDPLLLDEIFGSSALSGSRTPQEPQS